MDVIEIRGHKGNLIHSLDDWARYAMPADRKEKHWSPDRSACELGRLWTASGEPAVPAELAELLESHDATRGTSIRNGITELETALPPGTHGPRCHDLALFADQGPSSVLICIEAKADEPFGGTVAEEFRKAKGQERRKVTRFPERLDWLTRSLLGIPAFSDLEHSVLSEQIHNLPYQLFTAIAGTLLEAERQNSAKAVLVIHEFRTVKTTDKKMERNARELDRFLRLLLEANGAADENFYLRCGQLFGPIPLLERIVDSELRMPQNIPFFIGKIKTDCTATRAGKNV
jgi:hypothetical protein